EFQDDLKSHWTGWLSNRGHGQPYGDEKTQRDAFARTAIVGKLYANMGDETITGSWTKWWDLLSGLDWIPPTCLVGKRAVGYIIRDQNGKCPIRSSHNTLPPIRRS